MQDITKPPKPLYACAPLLAVADPMESIVGDTDIATYTRSKVSNYFVKQSYIDL